MKRVAVTLAVLVGLVVASQSAMAAAPVRRVVGFGYGYGVRPVVRMPARVVVPATRVVVPAARVVAPRVVPAPRVYMGPYGPAMGPVYGPVYRGYYRGYVLPRRGPVVLY
ncbi:MAG: hypothetical protein WD278_05535 [Pirellulales bacterium]